MDETVGHFKIIKKLGQGGMGDVYLAEDTRLDRSVALKFLPAHFARDPDALARFEREAKSAAALHHPHIVTVYEIGRHKDHPFIAMQYIEGDRLSDLIGQKNLSIDRVIEIAIQICDGLDEAHRAGIIHRDIKPDNVLLDKAGRVKLADFGLATSAEMTKITQEGSTVGTLHYMSPEQTRGEDLAPRSDLFSVGAILYEMVTGQMAFPGEHTAAITYSVTSVDPQPLSRFNNQATPELERIVFKALAKEAEMRYQSAADLLADLKQLRAAGAGSESSTATATPVSPPRSRSRLPLIAAAVVALAVVATLTWRNIRQSPQEASIESPATTAPLSDKPSVAVLPLNNLSGDPKEEYFADGMTETLITSLARIGGLRVISRTSIMQYNGTTRSIPEIASELGVTAIVEGSVMRVGDQVRVTAQLIDARTDDHVWAQNYDREMKNVLALQSDVALAIAGEIQVALTPEESARLESVREVNPDAYRAYLHGLADWNLRDEGDLRTALGYFRQAIDIDPGFAQARAGLANTYIVMGHWGYEPLELAFRLAEPEARKALEIDPNLGEAYAALAGIVHERDLDVPEARRLFQRSIELSPGYASAHQWLGELEFDVANFDASLAAYERAIALDPTSLIIRLGHAGVVAVVRGCEEAFALWEGVDADYPDAGAPKAAASSIALVCGDYDRMARETVAYNMFFQWTPAQQQSLERAWDDGGLRAFSETAARFCEEHVLAGGYVPTGFILTLYAAAQNWDAVFANLDKTYAEAGPWVFTPLILTQLFEPIADDPRYQAYVARLTGAE